jgi:hypothetical protein
MLSAFWLPLLNRNASPALDNPETAIDDRKHPLPNATQPAVLPGPKRLRDPMA